MFSHRVLIVEECAGIAHLEASMARAVGCAIDIAQSGAEALQMLESRPYEALLVGSPVRLDRGQLLLEVLMDRFPGVMRRTIVVTAHVDDPLLQSIFAASGVYAVVAKPFDVATLSRVMTECLRSGGASGPTLWIGLHGMVRSICAAIEPENRDDDRFDGGRDDTESVEISSNCAGMLDS